MSGNRYEWLRPLPVVGFYYKTMYCSNCGNKLNETDNHEADKRCFFCGMVPLSDKTQGASTANNKKPYLGIYYVLLTEELQKRYSLPINHGFLVFRDSRPDSIAVVPGSPAGRAGILENDIITEINTIPITGKDELVDFIRQYKVGDTIYLTIVRGRESPIQIAVILEEFPETLELKGTEYDKEGALICYDNGVREFNLGNFERALIWFDTAIKLDSRCMEAMMKKGDTLIKLGRNKEAIACYN